MRPLLPPPSRSPGPSSHPADGAHWQADCRIFGASMEDTPRQEALMEASKLVSPCGSLSDTSNIARWAAPIVLDQFAWIGGHMNRDTTATVESDDGHILEVSMWIHKAPALSYFCVHCHRAPNSEPDGADFEDKPRVVAAEGRFVLLRTSFVSSSGEDEYFMYKAGNDKSSKLASLDRLPHPSFDLPTLKEFAIVPLGHGDHYLVAPLCLGFDMLYYELCIYSSEDETWTSKLLQNPCPQFDKVIASKVVTLGEGIVGWVDLQHGILLCNLHETNPTARYIPLPDPLPENKDKLEALHPGPSARVFRDLTCINGVIKFFDMEHLEVTTQKPNYLLNSGKLYDSDVLMSRERKKPKVLPSYSGWKALTWSRTLSSNCWEMGPVLDAADIMLDSSMNLSLLSGLMGEADIDKKIVFKDLYSAYPTLSTDGDGDDILYLESLSKPNDLDGRMVVLDLGTKRVKALGEYSLAKHSPSVKAFSPCTVPHVTKGKIPATACIQEPAGNS